MAMPSLERHRASLPVVAPALVRPYWACVALQVPLWPPLTAAHGMDWRMSARSRRRRRGNGSA
eukprot:1379678-Alexandrium_andersonii.AAC.1